MPVHIEHFDLSDRQAVVLGADTPAGDAVARAFEEAGAGVTRLPTLDADAVGAAVRAAAAERGALHILACAVDRFVAKPVAEITPDDWRGAMQSNVDIPFYACQAAIDVMQPQGGGSLILMTHVLGQRGVANSSAYSAAHGAVHNLIRALAQEVAPHGISVNGVALGWMNWMDDRLDPDDADADRAVRFAISKRAGAPEDVGPIAVWLAGSGVGFVTGQIFPVDGGLTQHL